ncbi:transcriptional regulator [Deltaproteobacteria bacterium Smac51]|nr:transcriptional regulator [Deltaproteobacteria bacterium Smac51]
MELPFDELTPLGPCVAFFAQLFDHLPLGVSVHDSRNNIVYYNQALSRADEMDPAEVVGRSINEVYQPFDSRGLLSQRCLETRQRFINHHLFYYTRFGKLVNSIHHVFPLIHENRLLGCICFAGEYRDPAILPELAAKGDSVPAGKKGGHYTFEQIITQNPEMKRALQVTARSADSDSSIMIYGETGSGKEMFAQAAHYCGRRAKKPFLAVSCAAIPENLLEGILFGTVKGAFTGAQDRPGLMEMADGGTLFLDEINSMPLGLQAKMLRAIQEQTVNRIGGTKERAVSLKIISATNNHPHRAVAEGQLRPDLLYRLGVVIVEIPPLRSRKDDLELLTGHFIKKFNRKLGKNVTGLSPDMIESFEKHYWPGNVRELEHVIESAMNLVSSPETVLEAFHFSSSLFSGGAMYGVGAPAVSRRQPHAPAQPRSRSTAAIDQDELDRLVKALEESGGNAARAARALNISPQLMHHKLKKYGLKKRIVVKME